MNNRQQLLADIDKAQDVVNELAKSDGQSFRMSIPARQDDTDLFLADVLSRCRAELEPQELPQRFVEIFGNSYTPLTGKGKYELHRPESIKAVVEQVKEICPIAADTIAILVFWEQIAENRSYRFAKELREHWSNEASLNASEVSKDGS